MRASAATAAVATAAAAVILAARCPPPLRPLAAAQNTDTTGKLSGNGIQTRLLFVLKEMRKVAVCDYYFTILVVRHGATYYCPSLVLHGYSSPTVFLRVKEGAGLWFVK